jgi:hypothetical protein
VVARKNVKKNAKKQAKDARPPTPRPRSRVPAFQPRFTLMLLYLALFFFGFAFLLILPELLDVLASQPPGPEQEEAAKLAARKALEGRLVPVFLMALAAAGAGAYYRILPGMRPR